ncbi:MAG: peptidylprolyl isomerase [Rhizobiaceae bacterium]|nr:peptidylprolyl isomerase [Rhizobiaceae bacterium]
MKKTLISASVAAFMAVAAVGVVGPVVPAQASDIRYVVNGTPVTSYDIQRRAAFLRLQKRKGDLNQMADDEMINQTLRNAEAKRLGVRITDQAVDEAYARFVKSNKLTNAQMDQILQQSGVTKSHFKEFIRSQMAWGQAMNMRSRSAGGSTGGTALNERDMVRKMLEKGEGKPTATEYMLQQVIFVVPNSERGAIMGKRKREAEAMRSRFSGCAKTKEFAKGLVDVTVRDLGRFLAMELPSDWADQVKQTKVGGATSIRETDRGVEFIGVCSTREVSDDKVAKMMFQSQEADSKDDGSEALSKKYTDELRAKAEIVKR